MKLKKIFSFLLFLLFFNNTLYAKVPSLLITEIVDEASKILSSSDPVESKIIKLNDIAERNVDINGIGMYTLGKYRKSLSEDERIKYNKLFKSYFLKSFSSRLVDYSDPKINVVSQKKINEKYTIVRTVLEATNKNPELTIFEIINAEKKSSNYTIVRSKIVSSDNQPEIKVDWRIYTKNPERPLIRDLIVEGLSLARTQKEEFNSVLQNNDGDINALFKTLEEFIIK